MAIASQSVAKAYRRVQKYRKPEALQRLLEEQMFLLAQHEYLQVGQDGYVEGEKTANPLFQAMAPSTRMDKRINLARELRSHLPIREAQQRLEELEAQIGELMGVIQTHAPYLLGGTVGGGNGQPNLH